jgi:hypothetical protein
LHVEQGEGHRMILVVLKAAKWRLSFPDQDGHNRVSQPSSHQVQDILQAFSFFNASNFRVAPEDRSEALFQSDGTSLTKLQASHKIVS